MCNGSSLLFCCWDLGQQEKWWAYNLFLLKHTDQLNGENKGSTRAISYKGICLYPRSLINLLTATIQPPNKKWLFNVYYCQRFYIPNHNLLGHKSAKDMCGFHRVEAHTMPWKPISLVFWGLLRKGHNFILQGKKIKICTFGLFSAISNTLRLKVRGESWPPQHHSELCWWC